MGFLLFGLAHHTSLLLFIFPPLSCFSLSHVLSFVALFITTSIIDKKKPNIRSSRFFFSPIYLKRLNNNSNSIRQTTQCMSLSQQHNNKLRRFLPKTKTSSLSRLCRKLAFSDVII